MLTGETSAIARLDRAAIAGVALLAAGSFVLSYEALHQLAVSNHVPRPLAWIWPFVIDGFIITASLAVLHAVLTARPTLYPWLLVLGFSATSIAFNVLHAPPADLARLVAAIPPLTLVLSFELLMRQLRHRLANDEPQKLASQLVQARIAMTAVAGRRRGEVEQYALPEHPPKSMLDKAVELHRQHTNSGTRLTGKTLSQQLGISDGYARRLLRQVNADPVST